MLACLSSTSFDATMGVQTAVYIRILLSWDTVQVYLHQRGRDVAKLPYTLSDSS
jgi:hypothetical protein